MKIGILTFHNSLNYGSILQAYALQHYIEKKLLLNAEIIDYTPDSKRNVNSLFENKKGLKNLIKNIVKVCVLRIYKKREYSFNDFTEKYLITSKLKYTDENIFDISTSYDVVITGSDQIWNAGCIDFSWVYFLRDISVNKKISYAPSIGSYVFTEQERQVVKKCLDTFSAISIREKQGQTFLSNLGLENTISLVPDPTLLLNRNDYEDLLIDKHNNQCNYIFLYIINMDETHINKAIQIAKALNLKLVTVLSSPNSFKLLKYPAITILKNESPIDFLFYIKHADLVLVNSFHGTVFSILFEKKFFTLGDLTKDNRINTLLRKVNLETRAIDIDNSSIDRDTLLKEIDYSDIREKLSAYSENGKNFLKITLNSDPRRNN